MLVLLNSVRPQLNPFLQPIHPRPMPNFYLQFLSGGNSYSLRTLSDVIHYTKKLIIILAITYDSHSPTHYQIANWLKKLNKVPNIHRQLS